MRGREREREGGKEREEQWGREEGLDREKRERRDDRKGWFGRGMNDYMLGVL